MARVWKRFARQGRNTLATATTTRYRVPLLAGLAVPAIASLLPVGSTTDQLGYWVAAVGKVGPLPVVSSLGPLPVACEEALDGLRRRGEDGPTPARTRTLLVWVRVRVGVRA